MRRTGILILDVLLVVLNPYRPGGSLYAWMVGHGYTAEQIEQKARSWEAGR